jgi:pseudouridine synthase
VSDADLERLQKVLASRGVASRRAAEALIAAGRVAVNDEVVTELGRKIDPRRDRIAVDGRPVRPPPDKVYVALNKPPGVVSTTHDPWGRPTVLDLLPRLGRLYPVGRLDADSEGLMLMTNDGELANRLMHPRYGCAKEYRALVRGEPTAERLERLRQGVVLDDGPTAPAEVVVEAAEAGRYWLRVTLREGRKRQVRRMLAALDLQVERLQRVGIGSLRLAALPLGACRPLSKTEIAALRGAAGGAP